MAALKTFQLACAEASLTSLFLDDTQLKLCTQQVANAAKQESNDHHALAAGWRELAPVTLGV